VPIEEEEEEECMYKVTARGVRVTIAAMETQ
jgi:hypothetical protein